MHIQSSTSMSSWQQRTPPSQEQLKTQASDLFTKLDSSSKGYLDASDFSKALQSVQQDTSDSQSSEWFSQLDADADGKLTSDEFSSGVSEQLYNARGSMGAGGPPPGGMNGMQGMPPPPPPEGEEDSGKTVDELSEMLDNVKDSDSQLASDLQSIIDQFDQADSDQDGKVTREEAMAFKESQKISSSDGSDSTASANSLSASQMQLQHTLMQLMKSYGATAAATASTSSSSLSMTA